VSTNININVNVQVHVYLDPLMAMVEALKEPVQQRMSEVMHTIILDNFGSTGLMRPWDWQALSPKYAKKVGRAFATLVVTGALRETVRRDDSKHEASEVVMSNTGLVPYALAHHHGNPGNFGWTQPGSGELPARRVFPLDEADQVLPEANEIVSQAAEKAIKELFA